MFTNTMTDEIARLELALGTPACGNRPGPVWAEVARDKSALMSFTAEGFAHTRTVPAYGITAGSHAWRPPM